VSKFADSLPFYRQEALFERLGIHIGRGTMCQWVFRATSRGHSWLRTVGHIGGYRGERESSWGRCSQSFGTGGGARESSR
jgi:hypothetical protein